MLGSSAYAGPRVRNCALFTDCQSCHRVDHSECVNAGQLPACCSDEGAPQRRRAKDRAGQAWDAIAARYLEDLFRELFQLHDLNGNGLLEEIELIKLNEKIALLHYGEGADMGEVRAKYRAVFRARLDPDGNPVPYETFRSYVGEVVNALDPDPEAQEMILEQFIAEAESGCLAFGVPALVDESDLPFKPIGVRAGDRPATAAGKEIAVVADKSALEGSVIDTCCCYAEAPPGSHVWL